MTLKYITKDITTVAMGIVAHGVNCQHVMGSGVALAIRNKWPTVYEQFMKQPKGATMLGVAAAVYFDDDPNLIVVNCYTQLMYGYGGGKYASEEAIRDSVMKTGQIADLLDLPLYLPRMGCGLGGLKWSEQVEPIIQEVAEKFERIDIFICDKENKKNGNTRRSLRSD